MKRGARPQTPVAAEVVAAAAVHAHHQFLEAATSRAHAAMYEAQRAGCDRSVVFVEPEAAQVEPVTHAA